MKSNIFVTSSEHIYVVHSFCCFPCSWILSSWLYFNNNCPIWFFVLFLAKDYLIFMINSVSYFNLSSISFEQSKLKQNVLESLIAIISFSVIIMTLWNCYKIFVAFLCANIIGSLLNSLFGVNIFNPVLVVFLFQGFNFIRPAIAGHLALQHLLVQALVVNHLQ